VTLDTAIDDIDGILADADGDGYDSDEDCDDSNAMVNPGAGELCDGADNNCDGQIDEGVTSNYYRDGDGDGFGDSEQQTDACEAPDGYVSVGNDCDDTDSDIYPAAIEVCDGEDNDCDGEIDEDVTTTFYADADTDGYGDPKVSLDDCALPDGYVTDGTDCDDADPQSFPGGEEVCDEADNNCNGTIDEGVTGTYYADADADSYGVTEEAIEACSLPTGYSETAGDCDDDAVDIYPGATEVCDEVDNNCDGTIDEGVTTTYYADGDGDGYGDAGAPTDACEVPSSHVSDDTDCDDTDRTISPDGEEVCDSADNDCDGATDEDDATDAETWYVDSDGDGYGDSRYSTLACAAPSGYTADDTDCDDADIAINPAEAEICDGIDQDCDGSKDEDFDDTDGDSVADCIDDCPVYADPTVTGGDGSLTSPYASIASAITLRGSYCDEIVLMAGTFDENVDYGGEDLQISSYYGADYTTIAPSAGGSVVTIASGESSAASLSGVTISGGSGTTGSGSPLTSSYTHGGGLFVVSADPTITDCVIEGNSVTGFGGGVLLFDYDGTFEDNLVDDNISTTSPNAGGGGVYLDGDAVFVNNEIINNTKGGTSGDGGGLIVTGSPLIEGNWFEGNTASQGGGVRSSNANAIIINNVFYDNTPSGLTLSYSDTGPVINNTFIDNASYGIHSFTCCGYTGTTGPTSKVVNNIIEGSGSIGILVTGLTTFASLSYNNVHGSGSADYSGLTDPTGTNGNISADPVFTSSTDFSLQSTSPCVDAGTDTSSDGVTDDIDDTSRYSGSGYDMGAYESH
jgi:hypothetical protein